MNGKENAYWNKSYRTVADNWGYRDAQDQYGDKIEAIERSLKWMLEARNLSKLSLNQVDELKAQKI